MMHPNSRVYWINNIIGYGVFTTAIIPKGTITFVPSFFVESGFGYKSGDCIHHPFILPPNKMMRPLTLLGTESYSYLWNNDWVITPNGVAAYVNHSCASNTLMTKYGYEIAVRDIAEGEEITTSYITRTCLGCLQCFCGSPNCVSLVTHEDDILEDYRNQQLVLGIEYINKVNQPLLGCVKEWFNKSGQDTVGEYSL